MPRCAFTKVIETREPPREAIRQVSIDCRSCCRYFGSGFFNRERGVFQFSLGQTVSGSCLWLAMTKGRCRKLCLFRSQSCRLTREALDLIFSDHFSRNEPGVFETLLDALPTYDYYMHLADLKSYIEADERLLALYTNPCEWARKAMLNVAGSGKFFSDRTIAEDAAESGTPNHVEFERKRKLERLDHNQSQVILLRSRGRPP